MLICYFCFVLFYAILGGELAVKESRYGRFTRTERWFSVAVVLLLAIFWPFSPIIIYYFLTKKW